MEPAEICPGRAIQVLWEESEKPEANELIHGTILRMDGLRAAWDKDRLETLRTVLSRLVSPFFWQDQATLKEEFQIRLQLPTPFEYLSGRVEPPEALKSPHYILKGDVDTTGRLELERFLAQHPEIRGRYFKKK